MHVTYHSKALETGVLVIYTSGVLSRDGAEKSGTDSVNWVSSGPIWPIYYRDLKGVPPYIVNPPNVILVAFRFEGSQPLC